MNIPFAIPGALSTPTGGYAYARRLIREAPVHGIVLEHLPLRGAYPHPSADNLADAESDFLTLSGEMPVLIDGLAFGAMPLDLVNTIPCPIVALCHHPLALETGLDPALAAHLRKTETAALARAAHVLTTSHATAQILARDFNVPGEKITTALPGTDPAPRAMPSADGPVRILSVGSVTPRKGHERLVEALAGLHRDDWTLRIIGATRDPHAVLGLHNTIQAHGLEDRVEIAGAMPMPQVTAAYQAADLFVLASEYEGFGMAFVEAMSHGLPTVGLTCDAVEEATAGAACLVAPEDLAGTLRLLIADQGTRAALSDRCWTAAQTFLRWPQTMNIVASVLKRFVR